MSVFLVERLSDSDKKLFRKKESQQSMLERLTALYMTGKIDLKTLNQKIEDLKIEINLQNAGRKLKAP